MVPDVVLIVLFASAGGVLALVVESQKHLYPVYVAVLLFIAAGVLAALEKAVNLFAQR